MDKPLIKLKNMPASAQSLPSKEVLVNDKPIEMMLFQCSGCGVVQHNSDPVSYYREVIRATAVSSEMSLFRLEQFKHWVSKYGLAAKKVLEVGCGRGEYMEIMKQTGVDLYGLEFGDASVEFCRKRNLSVEKGFVDHGVQLKNKPFDAFYILNFLEHMPDISSNLRTIAMNLADEALGLVEVPNFEMILKENMFSEVITDHLFYFTESSLRNTMELNGFEVITSQKVWSDYILSMEVRKRPKLDLSGFRSSQVQLTQELNEFIDQFPEKTVAVWGAGHQSLAILAMARLEKKLAFVIDSAEFKQNKYTPASHIPIYPPKILKNSSVEAVIIIAGGFSDEITKIIRRDYAFISTIMKVSGVGLVHA
ncbi:class I SAM-dependent methyltransferase [Methylophaga sp.]|uniref:class I SAM-dependent methyltransferase n=1 Tax=Methylophaga sp. TaxID=2024840 RepID=UPI003A94B5C6